MIDDKVFIIVDGYYFVEALIKMNISVDTANNIIKSFELLGEKNNNSNSPIFLLITNKCYNYYSIN